VPTWPSVGSEHKGWKGYSGKRGCPSEKEGGQSKRKLRSGGETLNATRTEDFRKNNERRLDGSRTGKQQEGMRGNAKRRSYDTRNTDPEKKQAKEKEGGELNSTEKNDKGTSCLKKG